MRTEIWCGYEIRFVEVNGEWWAILKDICDALELKAFKVAQRLNPENLTKVSVETSNIPLRNVRYKGDNRTRWMLAVDEVGIYETLFASKKLEARKFRLWTASVLKKLRKDVGLHGYEVMRMTDKDIQDRIDEILDTLYFDEENGVLMQSITVQGGDVEQVPFMR